VYNWVKGKVINICAEVWVKVGREEESRGRFFPLFIVFFPMVMVYGKRIFEF